MPAEVGQPAPDFSLYDTDRNVRTLQEFRGKTVVLAFFPGAFTGVCTTEACTLRDSIADFEGMNAQVLGISVDGPFAQKAWTDANSVNYPFLSDFNRQAANAYDVALPAWQGWKATRPVTAPSLSSTARAPSSTAGLPPPPSTSPITTP